MAWREHVEQRMREWRASTFNEDGDRLALDDFLPDHIMDDLIDYMCSEYAAPSTALAPAAPVAQEGGAA